MPYIPICHKYHSTIGNNYAQRGNFCIDSRDFQYFTFLRGQVYVADTKPQFHSRYYMSKIKSNKGGSGGTYSLICWR